MNNWAQGPTVAFPRVLLEMWNDPIRELNFKCVGTAGEEELFSFPRAL